MRGALLVIALLFAGVATFSSGTAVGAENEWHSETPTGALGVQAPLGEIGDIEFWAPNRGVLITAGIEGVEPAGVYAYDGTGWHLYSTVCGGHEGRIAWAGPDEFWTVSDYATRQEGVPAGSDAESGRTLCQFRNGEVVASYAQPFGAGVGYGQMFAAACDGSADCWFAGEPLEEAAANAGAFHLYWDGGSLAEVPSRTEPQSQVDDPPGRVTGLRFLGGGLFESANKAPFVRQIDLGSAGVFSPVETPEGSAGPYILAGDPGQLWAVGTNGRTVLRDIGGSFESVPLGGPLRSPVLAASEPNGAAVWVAGEAVVHSRAVATVARVSANGEVSTPIDLPQASEELDGKGLPTAISCPAPGQCWLGTKEGWLFHLGGPLPQDTDPAMHVLITFRPEDESSRTFVPGGLPEDNSGETEPASHIGEEKLEPFAEPRRRRSLVYDVHQKIIGKLVLELSFKLRAPAHVQLRAKFHRKVVAKTPRLTLTKGPHKLHLKLDPKRWPTGLDFQVHPATTPKK